MGTTTFARGRNIWKGPDFKERVTYSQPVAKPYDPATGYSDYFLT